MQVAEKTNHRAVGKSETKLLRVGELAKAVGKTVRAIHLYEELGLLRPVMRTDGGFRLYHPDAVARITWVVKLQAIGFKLSEIQEFVREFEGAPSGRAATDRARDVFARKLGEIREQITQLRVIENDLTEALEYLNACQECSPSLGPIECSACEHQGHERGTAPPLFANLSRTAAEEQQVDYHVSVRDLKKADDESAHSNEDEPQQSSKTHEGAN